MKVLNAAILGFGNVGRGFLQILIENKSLLQKHLNVNFKILYIIDPYKGSLYSEKGLDLDYITNFVAEKGNLKGHPLEGEYTFSDVIEDKDIDLVIELTPTNLKNGEPGYTHIKKSLEKEKHVITTNKGPLALHFHELMSEARDRKLYLGFEGTVMSGTPLIKLIRYGFFKDIIVINGILNGTTNFILTEMEKGLKFDEALERAKILGYTEADPSMDIDGYDLVAKACILSSLITGESITPEKITRTSLVEYLKGNSFEPGLKYMIYLDFVSNDYLVTPKILDIKNPLRKLNGVINGVEITTLGLGEVVIFGPGAGRRETGYAVLTDIVDLIKNYLEKR